MILEIGTLTLFREKSVVHTFADLTEDANTRDTPVLSLRSNRVTIPIKTRMSTILAVVRGQNIPGTMRMTSVVVEEIRRDPAILQDPKSVDWSTLWRRKVSKYEADYNQQNWVSVHLNGEAVFVSGEGYEAIAEVEALANGAEITDNIVREAASNMLDALEDYVVEHDSQTAFVFTSSAQYLRAAILERRDRKTGAFAVAAYHPSPQRPVRLSSFLSFCADMTETLTHKAFLDRVQDMIASNTIAESNITPVFIQATRNRRKDLINQIENYEGANRVVYRPERPNFI
jgi:hypothetical protein